MCNLPVSHLDYIESFGILLVVEKKDFKILQVSKNIKEWTGIEAHQLLNQKLNKIPMSHFLSDLITFLSLRNKIKSNWWTTTRQRS